MTWVTDEMTRDMFSAISSLKLVDDIRVTPAEKKENKYWEVVPMICSVRGKCLELERLKFVSFTPRKPNPHGIKVYVLAASDLF